MAVVDVTIITPFWTALTYVMSIYPLNHSEIPEAAETTSGGIDVRALTFPYADTPAEQAGGAAWLGMPFPRALILSFWEGGRKLRHLLRKAC